MMITARSSSMRFSSSSVAMPSSPGIMMSTIAASNGSARAISSPSAPDEATRTSYPSRVSRVSRISRMISSSSTTRIVPWREVAIPLLRPCGPRGGRGGRQHQREPRPLSNCAVAADHPVVLVDDPVGNRQAEPGPAADRLRREERIVDAGQLLGRDPGPGIGDLGERLAVDDARRHREPAAARHRIAGVQEQVEEHLLQLVLDAADDHGLARQIAANLDAADLELMLEQREYVADHRIQIDLYAIIGRRSGTGEVQQPVDNLRGAESLPFDLLEEDGSRVVRIGTVEQHLRETRDAGERRVDFVGDAGG